MLKGAVAGRYALALYDLAQENSLIDNVELELLDVLASIEDSQDFRRVFYHPQVPSHVKKGIAKELFGSDMQPITLNFLSVVLDARREVYFKDIITEYTRLANETRNVVAVEVTSAIEVSTASKSNLITELSKATGKDVQVAYQVKPEIIGGMVIRIGNRVIDSSIARQLERLNEQVREIRVG